MRASGRRQLDEIGEPLPAVEAGLRWLRLQPARRRPSRALVHGDFRLGNLIVDEHGLAAVIDWELCHAGDPAEDLAWLCIRSWRFGNDDLPVAGLGELEPFLDAYEAAGGTRPDPERLRWWEAMGNVKWAVICARQAHDHLTGARPSAELASLGRRICEPEWDLLELDPAAADAKRAAGRRCSMQDRPTAPELLDAMAAKLFAEVREWVPRERRFQVLVLANLCAVIARELRAGDEPSLADARAVPRAARRPIEPTSPRGGRAARRRRASWRRAIRAGELDERLDEVDRALREHVAPQARGRAPGLRRSYGGLGPHGSTLAACPTVSENVLSQAPPSIADRLAGDVAGLLGGEVGDQRRDLGRLGHPARGQDVDRARSQSSSRHRAHLLGRDQPGQDALAVIPRRTFSAATVFIIPSSPAFEAA